MNRKGLFVVLVFFVLCYAISRIFQPVPGTVSADAGKVPGAESILDVKKVLPPEQLSQFKGISVYRAPAQRKDPLWRNPPDDELMPPKDPKDPHTGVM